MTNVKMSPCLPQPKQCHVSRPGVTTKLGVFSPWNGHRPLKVVPGLPQLDGLADHVGDREPALDLGNGTDSQRGSCPSRSAVRQAADMTAGLSSLDRPRGPRYARSGGLTSQSCQALARCKGAGSPGRVATDPSAAYPRTAMIVSPEQPDVESRTRTHLANERTYLAWFRTGITLIALGLAAAQFLTHDVEADWPVVRMLATVLVLTGIFVVGVGVWRYRDDRVRIDALDFRPANRSVIVTSAAALVVGVIAIAFVWLLRPDLRPAPLPGRPPRPRPRSSPASSSTGRRSPASCSSSDPRSIRSRPRAPSAASRRRSPRPRTSPSGRASRPSMPTRCRPRSPTGASSRAA